MDMRDLHRVAAGMLRLPVFPAKAGIHNRHGHRPSPVWR
jgi:hypothetical protein